MALVHMHVLDSERRQYLQKIVKLSPLSVNVRLLDIRQTIVSPAVGRGRVHAVNFVTPFRLWNDSGICNDRKVISNSGFQPPCWI